MPIRNPAHSLKIFSIVSFQQYVVGFGFYSLFLESKEVISSPIPIPIIMDAAVINGAVWTKMSPTPTPTKVMPPMAHELLSSFLVVIIFHLNIMALKLGRTIGKAYDKYQDYELITNDQKG